MIKHNLILSFLISALSVFSQDSQKIRICHSTPYRAFDFWIGDWETISNGKLAGTNHILSLQDGCLIQENWVSADGNYTGTSYNFYDPQDGIWHQSWIDNQGQSLRLKGQLEGTEMILKSGPVTLQNGDTVYHQITWTPNDDGTVRQHWQHRKEQESDWRSLFDGLYQKKNK